jgi:hypothetical protein
MSYDPPPQQRWAGQRPPGVQGTYVRDATAPCAASRCQAPVLAELVQRLSDQQHEVLDTLNRKEAKMEPTRALWCEQGDHSFSEKDPDMQVLTMQRKGPDGDKVTESRTTCGKCAAIVMTRIGHAQNATSAAELAVPEEQR